MMSFCWGEVRAKTISVWFCRISSICSEVKSLRSVPWITQALASLQRAESGQDMWTDPQTEGGGPGSERGTKGFVGVGVGGSEMRGNGGQGLQEGWRADLRKNFGTLDSEEQRYADKQEMETDRERHENGKAEGVRTETRDNDVKDRQERD